MTIKISLRRLIVVLLFVYALASYPCNYYMMRAEWGCYNNDPGLYWVDYIWRTRGDARYGPALEYRGASLLLSPITAPVTAVTEASKRTFMEGPYAPRKKPDGVGR